MLREEFLRLLREDQAFREEVRRQLLTEELLALPQKVAQMRLELHEEFQRVWKVIETLTAQVQQLVQQVGDIRRDVGDLKGWRIESEWREKAPAFLGRWLHRVRVLRDDRWRLVDDAVDAGKLTMEEAADLRMADLIARARRNDGWVFIVGEVSWTVGVEDVRRARRRADLLQKVVDGDTVALAAGRGALGDALEEAQRLGVAVVVDGREMTGLWNGPTEPPTPG